MRTQSAQWLKTDVTKQFKNAHTQVPTPTQRSVHTQLKFMIVRMVYISTSMCTLVRVCYIGAKRQYLLVGKNGKTKTTNARAEKKDDFCNVFFKTMTQVITTSFVISVLITRTHCTYFQIHVLCLFLWRNAGVNTVLL